MIADEPFLEVPDDDDEEPDVQPSLHMNDDDEIPAQPALVISAVWKGGILGLAFMDSRTLRFCQVPDTGPEFRMLQACKYQLKPEAIVVPSTSDVCLCREQICPQCLAYVAEVRFAEGTGQLV